MIDWRRAEQLAARVAGSPELSGPSVEQLERLSEQSLAAVVDYAQLDPRGPVPHAEAVTRAEWISANTASLRPLLDPAVEKIGAKSGRSGSGMRLVAAASLTLEAGAVLGLLSRRVMGQYDLALVGGDDRPPPRLLFVAPNLAAAQSAFGGASDDDFIRWVAVHELTHAVQFGAVDWLRPYLGGIASQLLASLESGGGVRRRPVKDLARDFVDRAGRGVATRDPMAVMLSREDHQLVGQMQAAMTVVEGHAEHVMDAAGAAAIPSLPQLRAAMIERRQAPGPLWRILGKVLGMEMKMRQYEMGRVFCNQVVREAGVVGLNRVWESPEALPSLAEIAEPQIWLERIGA